MGANISAENIFLSAHFNTNFFSTLPHQRSLYPESKTIQSPYFTPGLGNGTCDPLFTGDQGLP
jgi:hypothetical protein